MLVGAYRPQEESLRLVHVAAMSQEGDEWKLQASHSLGLKVLRCHFHYILWVQASHLAKPRVSKGGDFSRSCAEGENSHDCVAKQTTRDLEVAVTISPCGFIIYEQTIVQQVLDGRASTVLGFSFKTFSESSAPSASR